METSEIKSVLQSIGERVPSSSRLVLIGGSALALIGSNRPTIDLDFIGDDVNPNTLHRTILEIAKELNFYAEPVPLDRFIPIPAESEKRVIRIGQFGNLEVFVADPYSIALSKIDRGLDTDFEDLIFLIQNKFINLSELEYLIQEILPQSQKFDLNPEILDHLLELKERLVK